MKQWYMVTVVGKDQPGIVAKLTSCLFSAGCNLGEASMMRMAGSFTVMLMTHGEITEKKLLSILDPVASELQLKLELCQIEPEMHSHIEPNVSVVVSGADQTGIISKVTNVLAESGVNILGLESAVAGTADSPLYILHIEGQSDAGTDKLESALKPLFESGVDIRVQQIETIIG